jgi:hypothetical protein
MFSATARAEIKGCLEGFLRNLIYELKSENDASSTTKGNNADVLAKAGALKPFHEAMLPPEIRRINEFERSFSTRLGSTFEACAHIIAKNVHPVARRGYKNVKIEIPTAAANRIEELIAENNAVGIVTPFLAQVDQVTNIKDDQTVLRTAVADLHLVDAQGTEWFFEIKSPKPNKGQCLEVTQRLLTIHAMQASRGRGPTKTYFGMAYNPYGARASYKWTYANKHLDMGNEVLLQEEFWTVVGRDDKTYEALLGIYQEVGDEMGKSLIDQLAFGF